MESSDFFLAGFFSAEREGGSSLLDGGAEDVEKQTREEEEEVESFYFAVFFGREIRRSVSLGLGSGRCRETNQRRRRGVESRR